MNEQGISPLDRGYYKSEAEELERGTGSGKETLANIFLTPLKYIRVGLRIRSY